MDIFLARQPIFDNKLKVCGYEILYRNSYTNAFGEADADMATASVILNTFQAFGLDVLTGNKPVFINFTENLLSKEIATMIPQDSLVIEVLESVDLNRSTIEQCQLLKSQGYRIALDDFVYKPEMEPLLELADIVKVDFLCLNGREIATLADRLKNRRLALLAEKVETNEQFALAQQLGFSLFQGYFFRKPDLLTCKSISPLKTSYLQLTRALSQAELDFGELANLISQDLSLAYSLLRFVNSAAFGFKSKIRSVKHALDLLGEKETRKWVSLMLIYNLGKDKPDELVRLSLIRARFAELLSRQIKWKIQSEVLFLAGLFSLLDVILGRPLADVLQDIQPPELVKVCLLENDKETSQLFQMVLAYERGDWEKVMEYAAVFSIEYCKVIDSYIAALQWYSDITTN